MESLNLQINELHKAYNQAMNIQLPMRPDYERSWFEAVQSGVTPEMLSGVIAHRQKRIRAGVRHDECVRMRNLVGSDERIGELLEDWACLEARKRIKVMDGGKQEVMRATGRPTEEPTAKVRSSAEALTTGWEQVRKAMGQ